MKKLFTAGLLAVFALFLPSKARAVPLDIPYQVAVDTTNNTSVVVFTTNTFAGSVSSTSQWCLSHISVTAPSAGTLTMFSSANPLSAGTTDFMVPLAANATYDTQWSYRGPYCTPPGNTVLTIKSSVSGSTVTAEGYLFKGWNP